MPTLIKIHPDGYEEFKEQGSLCEAIEWNEDKPYNIKGNIPIVGCGLKVGSPFARTYASQDWWLTTEVTEIIEETNEYILFKTANSTYKLLR